MTHLKIIRRVKTFKSPQIQDETSYLQQNSNTLTQNKKIKQTKDQTKKNKQKKKGRKINRLKKPRL